MSKRAARRPPTAAHAGLRHAVAAAPPRLEVAQRLVAGGRASEAAPLLAEALKHPGERAEALYLMAIAAVEGKQASVAIAHAKEAVVEKPADARFRFVLGRALKQAGDLTGAVSAYRQAIEIDARHAQAHVSLGIALRALGQLDEAVDAYQRALVISPGMGAAQVNLATALALQAEREAAEAPADTSGSDMLAATESALKVDPYNRLLLRNHGVLLQRARRYAEAVPAFNHALGMDPTDAECCLRLGACLHATGMTEQAVAVFDAWLAQNEPSGPVIRSLSNLLTVLGRVDKALHWAELAATTDEDIGSLSQLCNAYQQCRRLEEALASSRKAIEQSGRRIDFYPLHLLCLNYLHEDPQRIFDEHAEFGRQLALSAPTPPRPTRAPQAARVRPARLKVGYLSGDFAQHSVAYFAAPLLQHHDTRRFEVFCYFNRAWGDTVTAQFKALGHAWFDCAGLSDKALAQRIQADGIDVLVDMSGHTANSRLTLFHTGPAPLQIGYLGYPTVTGVSNIDYRLTDTVIDPGDMPHLPGEQPLCLPRSMFCYRPSHSPVIGPTPALRNGHITFGSFNNIAKLSDRTLHLWAQAMHAVPGSRLLLKSMSMAEEAVRRNVTSFMQNQGITADRLALQAFLGSTQNHLELYNEVDIALDPYPYNGATTTCEALWMGVPVISLRGRTHTSRMGASILGAAGKAEWVAQNDAAFVAAASQLAADAAGLSYWRTTARASLQASALLDEPHLARSVEAAFDAAWAGQTAPCVV